jgi:hypothetical protein
MSGLDNTSQQGWRFGPRWGIRQRSAPRRRSNCVRSTALPESAIARVTGRGEGVSEKDASPTRPTLLLRPGRRRARHERDLDALVAHLRWPSEHRKRIRTTNLLERTFVEVRRRIKVIGRFPGEISALSLIWAVLELSGAAGAASS